MLDSKKIDQLLANTGDMCLKRRARIVLEELELKRGDRILDLGCGDGFYAHLLANLGKFSVVGIDDNKKALELARDYLGRKTKDVRLVIGDVLELPFKDRSFDKMIASEVLEHLPNDFAALKEWYRVLQSGGILAITVPSHNYPFLWDPLNWILEKTARIHVKEGFWAGIWNQHVRLYYPHELQGLIERAGFKLETIRPITHYCLPFNHYLLYIGYRLRSSSFLPNQIRSSMNKFSKSSDKTLFSRVLDFVNWFDRLNNRDFELGTPTVGIFIKARKI